MKKIKLRLRQIGVILRFFWWQFYCKVRKINNSEVWLIAERGDEARDNGYAFYKYMEKNHPNIDFKYVISKNSPDLDKIKDKKRIVYQNSRGHYILFCTCGHLLSTHIMGYSPEFRIFNKLDKWGWVHIRGKRVYLNHGIEQNNVDGLKSENVKLDMFVCATKPQYEYEVKELGFPEGVIKYTGMPRYDFLKNDLKNQIVLMPTWRANLFYCSGEEEFKTTDYFKAFDGLLRDKRLVDFLKREKMELIFYPHYEIQPYVEAFTGYNKLIKIATFGENDVQTLINESKLMITDYSSVSFDFIYLKKPVIYYQFDYEDFMKNHFGEGYFSYREDGFGEIENTQEELVDTIIGYVKNGCRVKTKYMKNRNKCFTLPDGGNCARVYEAIKTVVSHYGGKNDK